MKSNQIQKRIIKKIIEIELTEEEAKSLLAELNHICSYMYDTTNGTPQIIDNMIELLIAETSDD